MKRKTNKVIIHEDYSELLTLKGEAISIDTDIISSVIGMYWIVGMNGYAQCRINGKVVYLHRYITNCPDDMVVDHINHNKLDNRIKNLRICTPEQNAMNTAPKKSNKSGRVGVFWSERDKLWYAQIKVNRKTVHLGSFKKFEDAVKARKKAEIHYRGEYAYNSGTEG